MPVTERLLTPAEAAERLGMPEPTLRHWRNARTGPDYVRVGRHVRYEAAALDAWIAAQRVDAATGQARPGDDRYAGLRGRRPLPPAA